VDALLARAEGAGAALSGPRTRAAWGIYSGYFSDLDGTCGRSSGTRARHRSLAMSSQVIESPRSVQALGLGSTSVAWACRAPTGRPTTPRTSRPRTPRARPGSA
jgi:hypothetical protein